MAGKAGKPIKLDVGTVFQKQPGGIYFFRYQVGGKGNRKAVSLKTRNLKEAISKAESLIPLIKAPTAEVISEHVKHAKGWANRVQGLPLVQAWNTYAKHPDRATPATVSEQDAYRITYQEFVDFIGKPNFRTPGLAGK